MRQRCSGKPVVLTTIVLLLLRISRPRVKLGHCGVKPPPPGSLGGFTPPQGSAVVGMIPTAQPLSGRLIGASPVDQRVLGVALVGNVIPLPSHDTHRCPGRSPTSNRSWEDVHLWESSLDAYSGFPQHPLPSNNPGRMRTRGNPLPPLYPLSDTHPRFSQVLHPTYTADEYGFGTQGSIVVCKICK